MAPATDPTGSGSTGGDLLQQKYEIPPRFLRLSQQQSSAPSVPPVAPAPASKPVPTRVRAAATVPPSLPAYAPVPSTAVGSSKAQERLQNIQSTTKQTAKKDVGSFLIKLFNKFHIGSHAILLPSNTGMVNWVIRGKFNK